MRGYVVTTKCWAHLGCTGADVVAVDVGVVRGPCFRSTEEQ
jgi:hypothetical protein